MDLVKLIIFSLLVVLFSLSIYAFSKQNQPMTGVPDMIIPAFFILTSIVLGIIILVVLSKAPKLYRQVCFVLLIPLGLYILFSFIISTLDNIHQEKNLAIYLEQRNILDKAKKELLNKNTIEAEKLIKSVDSRSNESIQSATAEAYLTFYLVDSKYADEYLSLLEGNIRNAYTLNRFLISRPLTTEKECIRIFELLDKIEDSNHNSMLQREVEKNLSFPVMVEKKYYSAAIRSLDFVWSTYGYEEVALKIDQEYFRRKALKKIKEIQDKKGNNKNK